MKEDNKNLIDEMIEKMKELPPEGQSAMLFVIENFDLIEKMCEKSDMTDEEILDYIKTKEPMDKAGAYGIQGRFAAFVSKIEGDYNSVVGLPVGRVYQELRKAGYIG